MLTYPIACVFLIVPYKVLISSAPVPHGSTPLPTTPVWVASVTVVVKGLKCDLMNQVKNQSVCMSMEL